MPSVRIATITFHRYPSEPRALRLTQAAADAGFTVDVICAHQPDKKLYEISNGIRIYRMPIGRAWDKSLPKTLLTWCWFLLLAGATLTWLHLKHRYDVVYVHNMPDFLIFSALFSKLSGVKIILDVQDISPELMAAKAEGPLRGIMKHLAMWQEHISTTFADHVVTVGWPFQELLLKRGVPQEKLSIIINSADPKLFPHSHRCPIPSESSDEDKPLILMYHGTLAERNGLDTAIRALALARRVAPNVRLEIKGRPRRSLNLRQLATELGVSDSVVLSEPCPVSEVADFILNGDIGIIPYRYDGFTELLLPTKAYEFAWMHRAMIASDTPGIRSMFRPESIVLCDPASPESFAEAIIDLYQHPEKRARMVASAFEDYAPYRWELMAEHYQQLLASLCQK